LRGRCKIGEAGVDGSVMAKTWAELKDGEAGGGDFLRILRSSG
jgi:hypothetical protein